MNKLLEEINTEGLTADCVQRKNKIMKTVYSQEQQNYEVEEEWRRN
jgi:hypothetical protein